MFNQFRPRNAGSPTSPISITDSFASDTSRGTKSLYSAPVVTPPPAYVAFAAASQLATDNHIAQLTQEEAEDAHHPGSGRSGALFTEQALVLINAFLDELLYSFLCNTRSMSLENLENAVEGVLKGRLAQQALDAAQAELEELLSEEDNTAVLPTEGEEELSQSDTDLIFKRTRLRIMVYMRLGEMEDEDEERYVQRESESGTTSTTNKRFSQSSRMVPWSAAIFLTSILEFIAEQCIAISGETAYRRTKSERTQLVGASSQADGLDDRIYVDEYDVGKLALSKLLGRLWRIWKKNLRSRPKSRLPAVRSSALPSRLGARESTTPVQQQRPVFHDENGSYGSEDSDVLPKQGIAITSDTPTHQMSGDEVGNAVSGDADSDSDVLGRPALSKISEDDRSQLASGSGSDNPALFPLTNRSSLHSHPAFDAANYPPEIAAAAGLSSNFKQADLPSDGPEDDPYNLYAPGPVKNQQRQRGDSWAQTVADRVIIQSPILPSENAFAAQARAAEARSRSGTTSSIPLDFGSNPSQRKQSTSEQQDQVRLQPRNNSTLAAPPITPPVDRQGSVVDRHGSIITSPTIGDYSPAPVLGVAELRTAQPIQAQTITPPRSYESLKRVEKQTATPPQIKKPLKIPRHVVPTPTSSPANRHGLVAREPRVEGDSTRDFADFIRSTAPTESQTKIAPIMANAEPARMNSVTRAGQTSTSATSKPLPKLPRTARDTPSPPTTSLGRPKKSQLQPRDAVIRAHGTDDLVEFLRQGPPTATLAHGDNTSSSGTGTTRDRDGSVVSQSAGGSVTSASALVPRAPTTLLSRPPQPPAKTRHRIRDPYALPSSDEDDDDDDDSLTALPGKHRRQKRSTNNESMIDFLKNNEPPSRPTGPTQPLPSTVHANARRPSHPLPSTTTGPTYTSSSPTLPSHPTSQPQTYRTSMKPTSKQRNSQTPTAILSTSAFFTTSSPPHPSGAAGSSPLPDFMAPAPSIQIDLNQLSRRDPMVMKYNDFDGVGRASGGGGGGRGKRYDYGTEEDEEDEYQGAAAPAPNVSRDRGSREGIAMGGGSGSGSGGGGGGGGMGAVSNARWSGSGKKGGGFWRRV